MSAAVPGRSTILAMHARYEDAATALHAIDVADCGPPAQDQRSIAYSRATTALDAEQDALRTAILYQIPDSWADVLVIQYHINVATGLYTPGQQPEHERAALAAAQDAVLDFIACETAHDDMGARINATTELMFDRCRLRTGKLEA